MNQRATQAAIAEAGLLPDKLGLCDLPIDVTKLAKRLGVAEVAPAFMASDGYIGQRGDGRLVIRYNEGTPHQRKRFTIAHEIGHLLLAHHLGDDLDHRNRNGTPDCEEEFVVNRIASELLMPPRLFREQVAELIYRGVRSPWKAISILKQRFDVAESAAALRILELPRMVAVLFRINLAGRETKYPFDGSKSVRFSLMEAPADVAARCWQEQRGGSSYHNVTVQVDRSPLELKCQGRLRTFRSTEGNSIQYWVIGWQLLD